MTFTSYLLLDAYITISILAVYEEFFTTQINSDVFRLVKLWLLR